jgi:hypothetical protein
MTGYYDYIHADFLSNSSRGQYSIAWERVIGAYAAGRYYEYRRWIAGSGLRGFY